MKSLAASDGLLKAIDNTNNKVNVWCPNYYRCAFIITIERFALSRFSAAVTPARAGGNGTGFCW